MRNSLNFWGKTAIYSLGLACAWGACLAWHQHHAPVFEARATISVPDVAQARQLLEAKSFREYAGNRLAVLETGPDMEGEFEPEIPLNGEIVLTTGNEQGRLEIAYRLSERGYAVTHLQVLLEAFLQHIEVLQGEESAAEHAVSLEQAAMEQAAMLEMMRAQQQELQARVADEHQHVSTPDLGKRGAVLEAALAEAKLARLDAEHDLLQANRALSEQMPIELMKAVFTDDAPQQIVQEVVEQKRLLDDLEADRAMLEKMSKVYGAKHPQRIDLERRIAEKTAELESVPNEFRLVNGETTPQAVVRAVLERNLADQQMIEDELQTQFDFERSLLEAHTASSQEQLALAQRIQAAEQQLADIELELEQTRAKPVAPAVEITRNPWLVPDPVSFSLPALMFGGIFPGLTLGWILSSLLQSQLKPNENGTRHVTAASHRAAHRSSLHERRQQRMQMLARARARID